jgi:hypothetical protein
VARRFITPAAQPVTPAESRALPARSANVATLVARPNAEDAPLAATQALRVIQASFAASPEAEWESASPLEAAPRHFDAPPVTPRRASRRLPTARLATLSDSSRAPRLRAARFATAPLPLQTEISGGARFAVTEAPSSSQVLRVALPSASAPQPARLLAEFDSDDERIEEARSVVDDFRAAVDPDENSFDTTAGDDENTG